MAEKNNNSNNTRRDFIKKGILAGVGTVFAGGLFSVVKTYADEPDTVKVLDQDGKVKEVDKSHLKEVGENVNKQLQKSNREGIPNKKWVMVIDLGKCRDARKCMESCQSAHQLWTEKDGDGSKVQHHINVHVMNRGSKAGGYFLPRPCQHCDNPPCTKVCPVNATFKRNDGIVLIDNARCVGCRFCVAACPYSARTFNWFDPKDADKYKDVPYNIELNVPQRKGTVSKCVFSADQIRVGKLPYCATACPNGVYWFGDEYEDAVTNGTTKETVRFSNLLKENAGYTLLPELGTKPSVWYLPEKDRLFPFEDYHTPSDDNAKHH